MKCVPPACVVHASSPSGKARVRAAMTSPALGHTASRMYSKSRRASHSTVTKVEIRKCSGCGARGVKGRQHWLPFSKESGEKRKLCGRYGK